MAIRNKPARLRTSPWAAVNFTRAITTEHSYFGGDNVLQPLRWKKVFLRSFPSDV